MKYEQIKGLEETISPPRVKRFTFGKMINILTAEDSKKKSKDGRKNKLCIADQLLMTLEYIHEYRTYFRISQSYDVKVFGYIRRLQLLLKHIKYLLTQTQYRFV